MLSPSRRIALALCLVAGPALLTFGDLIHPRTVTDSAEQLEIIARHRDAFVAAHVLIYLGVVLLIPVLLGMAALIERCRPGSAWTTVGAALGIAGAVALAGVTVIEQVRVLMVDVGGDRVTMAALDQRTLVAVVLIATVHAPALGLTVGMAILAIALWRTRTVSRLVCGGVIGGALLA